LDYSNAMHHYARGVALARQGKGDEAMAERDQLAAMKDSVQVNFMDTNDYPASVLLNIADHLLLGEIDMSRGIPNSAAIHFKQAVDLQDTLPYMEPPFWYYPTRQSLGEALLEAGRNDEAEAVYRKDLVDYPHNGWSMYGLMQALEAQGKTDEAAKVREMFHHAWSNADVELTGSRL
ncbi:MAG: tetratricopeptide repeat protein, partial [Henriciella sp.]